MLPQLVIGACLTAGAVWRCRRMRRRRRREAAGHEERTDPTTMDLGLHYRELQQLLEVAIGNPRMLLTARWQARVEAIIRRTTQTNGSVPWQLSFVYRQLETVVDTLSYDELYDLFGGHPTPPAITRDEVKALRRNEFASAKECACGLAQDEPRSDQVSCPICLEDYTKGDKRMVLPSCNHVFHSKCVMRWLRSRGDCPICRRQISVPNKAAMSSKSGHLSNQY